MRLILIVSAFFLFLTGCSKNTNPVSESELHYMTGQIFTVSSSIQSGLALICMENTEQKEYLLEFENQEIEDIAYYNQGKNARVGYQDSYVSKGLTYLRVKEVEILNN